MTDPLVSVLATSYNHARYLRAAVDSVLTQSFGPERMEILVIDDGSTDGSGAVLRSFSSERVHCTRKEHGGQASALNLGLRESRGAIIAFLDGDDLWHPDKLRRCVEALHANPQAGCVQHLLEKVDATGAPLPGGTFPDPNSWPPRYGLENFVSGQARFAATSALVFRKQVLERILPIPESFAYSADSYLYQHALFYAQTVNLPIVLGAYRIHGENRSAYLKNTPARILEHIRFIHAAEEHLDLRLEAFCARMAPEIEATRARERFKREVLLKRIRGLWKEAALSLARCIGSTGFGAYCMFQTATLCIALLWPGAYLGMLCLYGSSRRFLALRKNLAPGPKDPVITQTPTADTRGR